jgi:hypothetical protein
MLSGMEPIIATRNASSKNMNSQLESHKRPPARMKLVMEPISCSFSISCNHAGILPAKHEKN